jgi:hypothetical protein
MTSVCVNSTKSMGYHMICPRRLCHGRRLLEIILFNDFSILDDQEQLGAEPPYYVWGGHPLGLASPPVRQAQSRGPPHGADCILI